MKGSEEGPAQDAAGRGELALALARRAFGLDAGRATPLPGDLDRNFLLEPGATGTPSRS